MRINVSTHVNTYTTRRGASESLYTIRKIISSEIIFIINYYNIYYINMSKYYNIGKYKFCRELNGIILILVVICCVDK